MVISAEKDKLRIECAGSFQSGCGIGAVAHWGFGVTGNVAVALPVSWCETGLWNRSSGSTG